MVAPWTLHMFLLVGVCVECLRTDVRQNGPAYYKAVHMGENV